MMLVGGGPLQIDLFHTTRKHSCATIAIIRIILSIFTAESTQRRDFMRKILFRNRTVLTRCFVTLISI